MLPMWQALEGRNPLILMDVHLPDVDGLTAATPSPRAVPDNSGDCSNSYGDER